MPKASPRIIKWRGSAQIRGIKSQLTAAIASCHDGAYVQLHYKTAQNLAEICDQAAHTEEGQEAQEGHGV